jgi:ABC-2 type transport system permease protein
MSRDAPGATWLDGVRAGLREEWQLVFGGHTRHARSGVLTVLLAIPLLYPAVVAYLYHAEDARERPALLVDLDGSALSRRLALALEATPELRLTGRPASVDEGVRALRRDEAEVLLVIPEDFTRHVKRGERGQLAVWSTGGNVYTWGIAFPAVAGVVGTLDAELAARTFVQRGLPPAAARLRAAPILTGDRRLFHPTGSYGRYTAAGVLLVVLQQLVVVSLAFSAGVRRERGGVDCSGVALAPSAGGARLLPVTEGVHPFGHLVGMAAAHAPSWLAGLAFVGLGVFPWMGWSGPSVLATAALLGLFALAIVPVSVAVASLVPDRMSAFQLLMFFSAPLFLASGFTWPASQMPGPVRWAMAVFPATPALRALRVVSMKSGELSAVLPELRWLAVQALAYALLAALVVLRPWRRGRVTGPSPRPTAPAAAAIPVPSTEATP